MGEGLIPPPRDLETGEKALVILSGGQDSTTALYWALHHFGKRGEGDEGRVEAVTFDYGQRHRIELTSARRIAELAGVPHTLLPIDTFTALGGNALTDDAVPVDGDDRGALPITFVPGRNLIFLTFAAAFAWPRGIRHLILGVAQTDYSGYPDCRERTIKSQEQALNLGMESRFVIHTPLMHLSKSATVELARSVGALPALALSHTCYRGEFPPCMACEACRLRAEGFRQAGVADPLLARQGERGDGTLSK